VRLDPKGWPVGALDSTPDEVTTSDILLHACQVPLDKQNQSFKQRVSKTLQRLGWKQGWAGNEDGRYRVYKAPK